MVSAVTTAPHTNHRHFIYPLCLAGCLLYSPVVSHQMQGLNPLEDGWTWFGWTEPDPCQGPLTSSACKNGNGDKRNQNWSFSRESAFVGGYNDDIVTTSALIAVEG